MIKKEDISQAFRELQEAICSSLEKEDGKARFQSDEWTRDGGGGGLSRILEGGNLIEKGGVNFSAVFGKTPEKVKTSFGYSGSEFFATGVSIVLHPANPHVPIIHMNIRYFEMNDGTWWFGGGIDLTPHYIHEKNASFFHHQLKQVCDRHDASYYTKFKKWADDYFFLPHRNETRGIGGIFFDRLNDRTKDDVFHFSMSVGQTFIPVYRVISREHRNKSFSTNERNWQLLRRGRYVEFNLLYDRGTRFGLESNGRTESILMSLPPYVSWKYNVFPRENSPEHHTQQLLKKDIDWIND